MFKKHWFYRLGPKKYQKSIGFIDVVKKVLKKHWFYRLGPKKYQKSIGFIDSFQKSIKKALVL